MIQNVIQQLNAAKTQKLIENYNVQLLAHDHRAIISVTFPETIRQGTINNLAAHLKKRYFAYVTQSDYHKLVIDIDSRRTEAQRKSRD